MKLSSEGKDFVKQYRGMIQRILEGRKQEYMNAVIDEQDPQKREVLALLVKEFRYALVTLENIGNEKETSKPIEPFTGV